MGRKTPFYDLHVASHAKMIDFFGWDMPLHYGSQLEEHHIVRQNAGMFDVSHMGVVDIKGPSAKKYLQFVLANNVGRLVDGKALYTCMLNELGGILDDLIVYQLSETFYRIVVNASNREKDLSWLRKQASLWSDLDIQLREDLVMLAIQGPNALSKIERLFPEKAAQILALKPFHFLSWDDWFVARTGYTGEDGVEVIFPAKKVNDIWNTCLAEGIKPCGLGSRDTLRLEAGLCLYGMDMNETVTPLESNLTWTVAFEPSEREFIGRNALEKLKNEGISQHLIGLVLLGPGIIRHQQRVFTEETMGEVTSGGYSPTLQKSIALARMTGPIGKECWVEIRGKSIPAQVVKPPFVRQGKK